MHTWCTAREETCQLIPRGERPQLPEALLQGASAEERERLFSALRIGEIRKRQDGGDIFVRSGKVPHFVLLKPLQRTDGPLRADARRTLIEADNLLDEPQAQGLVDYMAQIEETYGRYLPTQLHSLSRDLLADLDSVAGADRTSCLVRERRYESLSSGYNSRPACTRCVLAVGDGSTNRRRIDLAVRR